MRIAAQKSQIGIFLALLGLLGGAGFYILQQNGAPTPNGSTQGNSPTSQVAPQDHKVSIYWIEASEKKFKAVPVVVKGIDGEQALEASLKKLLDNPPDGFFSGIPTGTKLLNFTANDRDIFVNVSAEFRNGGGSSSMIGRVTQLVYTATSLNPDANVFLLIEGEPIGALGGEGLEIKQPMTRKDLPLEF
jgi:spore germination protein GerM